MFNIDHSFLNKNLTWLKDRTIYTCIHGSHAYGTNNENSDIDLRGIAVAPKEYYLGLNHNFEQATFMDPYDAVIFDIKKFFQLCTNCNPNTVELLFVPEECMLMKSDAFHKIYDIRDLFLTKRARGTFQGYALSQLKRIKTHRKWLLDPITTPPTRESFGLPDNRKLLPDHQMNEIESQVKKRLSEWQIDMTDIPQHLSIRIHNEMKTILEDLLINSQEMYLYAARSLGLNDNLLEAFKKEREYKNAHTNYRNYKEWEQNRNDKRYEIEKKFGYDCKHASHLVRLTLQCIELFETGKLNVRRSDAEELIAIKNGSMTYEQLMEWTDIKQAKIEEIYKTSTLPSKPNLNKINEVLISIIEDYL